MAEPFIGEIRAFGFNFQPRGWAFCNGQLLPIAQNDALFAVIGTIYGGDGSTTFALPNLRGQSPMHWGKGQTGLVSEIGQAQGQASVTLTTNQIPQHNHVITSAVVMPGQAAERSAKPSNSSFLSANTGGEGTWQNAPVTANAPFSAKAIGQAGNSQPHENMQPYLVLNFCIALEGIFPSRN